ncbi:MAG: hypothetical protein WCK74_13785 [Gemmatimonadaceae bacterium]|jgi:hypothetical protein
MKGGKNGVGRKGSSKKVGARGNPRGGSRKNGARKDFVPAQKKVEKTTTRLGANRHPDDA